MDFHFFKTNTISKTEKDKRSFLRKWVKFFQEVAAHFDYWFSPNLLILAQRSILLVQRWI